MRLFELRRTEDESGVSGTGTVAQGVIFDNGWCALTWLTPHTSVAFYTSIEEVVAIHGHEGKTKVVQIADYPMETVRALCDNMAQDYCEGIAFSFRTRNHTYLWQQRERFAALFLEKILNEGGGENEEGKESAIS